MLTVIGVAVLLTGSLARNAISVIGGLILIVLRLCHAEKLQAVAEASGQRRDGQPYLMGLVMGLTNPLGILWWVTAGAAFVAMFNVLGVAGFMLGLLAWISSFSVFVHFAGKKVDIVYPIVIVGSGLMMLFFGLLLLYGVIRPALGF